MREVKSSKLRFLARKPNATGSDWTYVRDVRSFKGRGRDLSSVDNCSFEQGVFHISIPQY